MSRPTTRTQRRFCVRARHRCGHNTIIIVTTTPPPLSPTPRSYCARATAAYGEVIRSNWRARRESTRRVGYPTRGRKPRGKQQQCAHTWQYMIYNCCNNANSETRAGSCVALLPCAALRPSSNERITNDAAAAFRSGPVAVRRCTTNDAATVSAEANEHDGGRRTGPDRTVSDRTALRVWRCDDCALMACSRHGPPPADLYGPGAIDAEKPIVRFGSRARHCHVYHTRVRHFSLSARAYRCIVIECRENDLDIKSLFYGFRPLIKFILYCDCEKYLSQRTRIFFQFPILLFV